MVREAWDFQTSKCEMDSNLPVLYKHKESQFVLHQGFYNKTDIFKTKRERRMLQIFSVPLQNHYFNTYLEFFGSWALCSGITEPLPCHRCSWTASENNQEHLLDTFLTSFLCRWQLEVAQLTPSRRRISSTGWGHSSQWVDVRSSSGPQMCLWSCSIFHLKPPQQEVSCGLQQRKQTHKSPLKEKKRLCCLLSSKL